MEEVRDLTCEPAGALPGGGFAVVCTAVCPGLNLTLTLTVEFTESGDRVSDIRTRATGSTGLMRSRMARLPIQQVVDGARAWAVRDGEPTGLASAWQIENSRPAPDEHARWKHERLYHLEAVDGASGARRWTPQLLREFAAYYVWRAMDSDHPAADAQTYWHLSQRGVGMVAAKARKAGWLAPTTRGARRGIQPGPRLLAWWGQNGWPDWYSDPWVLDNGEPEFE